MKLYLIRHAQSLNNARPESQRVEDPPLTDVGYAQARCLAAWIPSVWPTRLQTSPFLRALETTEFISRATGLRPEVHVELHEQGGCMRGTLVSRMVGCPGLTRKEILSKFPAVQVPAEIDGDGWWRSRPYETRELASARAQRLWARLQEQYAATDERIVCVMHGEFLRLLMACFHADELEPTCNTSVTSVTLTPTTCRLEEYNRTSHLPDRLLT